MTIVVCTYGERDWIDLAHSRAIPSAKEQARTVHSHGTTLANARNKALYALRSAWVIYLDADDELEPGYVKSMSEGAADLRAPAVRYVRDDREFPPRLPRVSGHKHECVGECLPHGNFICIGAAAKAEFLRQTGGWREFPMYEDWDLWLRAWRLGATVESLPEAIYRAHVRDDSRNRAPSPEERLRVHHEIVAANPGLELAA